MHPALSDDQFSCKTDCSDMEQGVCTMRHMMAEHSLPYQVQICALLQGVLRANMTRWHSPLLLIHLFQRSAG